MVRIEDDDSKPVLYWWLRNALPGASWCTTSLQCRCCITRPRKAFSLHTALACKLAS